MRGFFFKLTEWDLRFLASLYSTPVLTVMVASLVAKAKVQAESIRH